MRVSGIFFYNFISSSRKHDNWPKFIMLLTQKNSVEEVVVSDIRNVVYQKVNVKRQCQVELIELLLLERKQEGLEDSDLEWLEWLCTD